jgi:hypothetical protein
MLGIFASLIGIPASIFITWYFTRKSNRKNEVRSMRLSLFSAKLVHAAKRSRGQVFNLTNLECVEGKDFSEETLERNFTKLILDPDFQWVLDRCLKCGRYSSLYKDLSFQVKDLPWSDEEDFRSGRWGSCTLRCDYCDFYIRLPSLFRFIGEDIANIFHYTEMEFVQLMRDYNNQIRKEKGFSHDEKIWLHEDRKLFHGLNEDRVGDNFPEYTPTWVFRRGPAYFSTICAKEEVEKMIDEQEGVELVEEVI